MVVALAMLETPAPAVDPVPLAAVSVPTGEISGATAGVCACAGEAAAEAVVVVEADVGVLEVEAAAAVAAVDTLDAADVLVAGGEAAGEGELAAKRIGVFALPLVVATAGLVGVLVVVDAFACEAAKRSARRRARGPPRTC